MVFSSICKSVYRIATFFEWLLFDSRIRKNEMPIKIYKLVHTGPNNQLGGRNEGYLSVSNQAAILLLVTIPAHAPSASGTVIQASKVSIFFMLFDDRHTTVDFYNLSCHPG